MTTWRERIQAARESGKFTEQDHIDIRDFETCMLGEVATRVFGEKWEQSPQNDALTVLGLSHRWSKTRYEPVWSVIKDKPDEAERALDHIEDEVLRLKREMTQ